MKNNYYKKVVIELPIEAEVKEILEEHEGRLNDHDDDIHDLKIQFAKLDKGQENIEKSVNRLENIVLTTQNSILNTLNQFVDNTTKKQISEGNNRKDIMVKAIWVVGSLVAGLLAGGKIFS